MGLTNFVKRTPTPSIKRALGRALQPVLEVRGGEGPKVIKHMFGDFDNILAGLTDPNTKIKADFKFNAKNVQFKNILGGGGL